MIKTFIGEQGKSFQEQIGQYHLLLIEGKSKKDQQKLIGKTDTFMKGFIENRELPTVESYNLS
jgi:hypothetical protein